MARNLEIKVRCDEATLADVRRRAERRGAGPFASLRQVDTYFAVSAGRLKLREIEDGRGGRSAELIAYRRPDEAGSRWSNYRRIPLDLATAAGIMEALSVTCGVRAVVVKRRDVAVVHRTRIHLDRVDGLGCFVELETVARDGDSDDDLAREHEEIIRWLGLDASSVVAGSYGDLAGSGEGENNA